MNKIREENLIDAIVDLQVLYEEDGTFPFMMLQLIKAENEKIEMKNEELVDSLNEQCRKLWNENESMKGRLFHMTYKRK